MGSRFSLVSSIEFDVDEFEYVDMPSFSVEATEGDIFVSILILVVAVEGVIIGSGLILSPVFEDNEVAGVSDIFLGSGMHDVDGFVFGFVDGADGVLDFKGVAFDSDKADGKLIADDDDDGGNTIAAVDRDVEVDDDDDDGEEVFGTSSLFEFLIGSDTSIHREFDFVVGSCCCDSLVWFSYFSTRE